MRSRLAAVAWKPKFQAFAVHFSISLMIFLTLMYFILFQWYPQPFFTTDGGTQGLKLIILVDLVLGPTLTFIVFNRYKPSLKFDLSVIALLQVAALSYGVWAVHNERPVAIVFADDRFTPIPYYQFIQAGHQLSDLYKFGDKLPVSIYVELPDENQLEARVNLFRKALNTGTPLYMMGDRYRRLNEVNRKEIARHAIDMEDYLSQDYLKDKKITMQQTYNAFLTRLNAPPQEFLFLPVYARYCKCFLVAERATLKFIGSLNIPPPQITNTHRVITIKRNKPAG